MPFSFCYCCLSNWKQTILAWLVYWVLMHVQTLLFPLGTNNAVIERASFLQHKIHHNAHVKETRVGPMPSVGKWVAHEDAPVCLDLLAIHHPVGLSVWCQANALHSLPVSSIDVLILVEVHVVSKPSVKLSTIIQSAVVSQASLEIPSFAALLSLLKSLQNHPLYHHHRLYPLPHHNLFHPLLKQHYPVGIHPLPHKQKSHLSHQNL